jgi:hypothetical protein
MTKNLPDFLALLTMYHQRYLDFCVFRVELVPFHHCLREDFLL